MPQQGRPVPEWAEFERAVTAFLGSLDSSARVQGNARVPDRHTGKPRQRDVWISARLLGHFPVSILVSCKRYRRKLNQQDIDAFEGERQSSGAQVGVLYSYSGFAKAAIDKARVLGISCCRLFRNEPPEVPLKIGLPCYSFRSQIRVDVLKVTGEWRALNTYDDLFRLRVVDGSSTVLERIEAVFQELDREAVEEANNTKLVQQERYRVVQAVIGSAIQSVQLRIVHRWKIHKGRVESYLVNGSYSETEESLLGHVAYPVLDTQGTEPGPGWELLSDVTELGAGPQMRMVLHMPQVGSALHEAMGRDPLVLSPIVDVTREDAPFEA